MIPMEEFESRFCRFCQKSFASLAETEFQAHFATAHRSKVLVRGGKKGNSSAIVTNSTSSQKREEVFPASMNSTRTEVGGSAVFTATTSSTRADIGDNVVFTASTNSTSKDVRVSAVLTASTNSTSTNIRGSAESNKEMGDGRVRFMKVYSTCYCPYCKLEVEEGDVYFDHILTHSHLFATELGDNLYQCKYCPKKVERFRNMCQHVQLKPGENVCSSCGDEINSRCQMNEHKRFHYLEKKRWCGWCMKSFPHMKVTGDFTKHVKQHMRNGEERKDGRGSELESICAVCGRHFRDK
jgi:hypothetical protein